MIYEAVTQPLHLSQGALMTEPQPAGNGAAAVVADPGPDLDAGGW